MNLDMTSLILIIVLGLSFLVQLFYYFYYFAFYTFKKEKKNTETEERPVSIVICARDEEDNLQKNLTSILQQDYKNYEVVVVDDCSEDNTSLVLENFKKKYPHLRTTFIKKDQKFNHGKKLALSIGIKSAKHELLLLTDSDCEVKSTKWLSKMQQHFSDKTEIVLGYGKFNVEKGFLDKIIRFDTFFIALQYFSYAHAGIPYMGVGRNLSYKKTLFQKNRGFASHLALTSGDDDLFINEVANSNNVAIEDSLESFTYSKQKKNIKEWFAQKKRHFTTSKNYKLKHKLLLSTEILSRFFFYLTLLILLFFTPYHIYFIGVYLFRLLIQIIIVRFALKRLNEKALLIFIPVMDILLPILHLSIKIANIFTKKHTWK